MSQVALIPGTQNEAIHTNDIITTYPSPSNYSMCCSQLMSKPVRSQGRQLLTQVNSPLLSIKSLYIVRTHNNRMLCMYFLTISGSQYFVCRPTWNFTCFLSAIQACNWYSHNHVHRRWEGQLLCQVCDSLYCKKNMKADTMVLGWVSLPATLSKYLI